MLTCSNCGTANDASRKFCAECGQRLASTCQVCGTVNQAGAKFCGECGNVVGDGTELAAGGVELPAPGIETPVAERRLVSVLFTDLVGFTSLSESRDAEDTRELLSRYFETAREIVDRHGGVIEKFIGDAVMAVWGTPIAHEDDAERAVRTALQLVEAVGHLESGGQLLQARAGVLTGEAAVTIGAAGQGMVAGDLVNTASRLQSAAAPGSVLVGEETRRAAGGAIAFEDAGGQQLKGKESPVPAWRAVAVVARRGGQGRAATLEPPFVGRDEELRTLKDQFHATAREGKPRLVTLVGQAGIGKSRLGWELEKYLDGVVEPIFWHEGRSPSYGEGISYWALAEMIRGRAGIADSEEPEAARHRLDEMLTQMVPDPTERRWIEPRLTGLLGLEELPSESREELFAAWRTFFERMAEQATVLLVFWDLQWADQGLLDFIEHLLTWARTSPVFVLAEARPELFERRPGWGVTVRSSTSIHLEPLSDSDMRTLLFGLVPSLPDHALRAIVERAAGVPLYAVETLRMLIDRGVLKAQADGAHYALAADLPELTVPASLHALVAARLDTLEHDARTLTTNAAVLGLSFTVESLRALSELEPDSIARQLEALVRREVLVLDADPRSPERGQYRFIQGVVREVAYQSLAKRDRRAKHLAAARYFEALGEDELAGVLASHYLAAYRATPEGPEADALAAQARVALRAAAERAAALHSQIGALGYLNQAIGVTDDPREQALLHERAATAATHAARMPEGLGHAQQAERIFNTLGDRLGVLRTRTLQAYTKLAEHGDRDAIAILEGALAEVSDLPPSAEIALAQSELARAHMVAGSSQAIVWANMVLARPELVNAHVLVMTLITKGTAQINEGFLTEGEVVLRGAIIVADRLGDQMSALRARNNLLGVVEPVNLEDALALVRETFEIAKRFGEQTWVQQALGTGLTGSFDLGRWDDWMEEAREQMPQAAEFYRLWYRAEEAHRMAYRGQLAEASAILDEVVASDTVRSSAQASATIASLIGEIRILEGRHADAFQAASEGGWNHTDAARYALIVSLFAAVAAADQDLLATTSAGIEEYLSGDQPMTLAVRQIYATLSAVLDHRWEDARQAYLAASRTLESAAQGRLLAWLRMAVGHAAGDHFREAADGLVLAEAWFDERGAGGVVRAYRGAAVRPGSAGAPSSPLRGKLIPAEPAAS